MKHHRFGLGNACFELATDYPDLLEFWQRYSRQFRAHGEPVKRYTATLDQGPTFTGSDGTKRRFPRALDLFPVLEGAFLADLLRAARSYGTAIHAAAIGHGPNATVYLGSPGAGKSTLSVQAVQNGGIYLSDDVVVVEGDEVLAVPRPISFGAHEQPPELRPDGDERFEAFGYDYLDFRGQWRRAMHYLPRSELVAIAGQRFRLGDVVLLERDGDGPPVRRLLEGAELRARLAVARFRSEP